MKKSIIILIFSALSIFTMSCDAETIAALSEVVSTVLQTPGCMKQENGNYDATATVHVDSLCAQQTYGCTDATAINFNPAATNMCTDVSANECCTSSIAGCLTQGFEEYNDQANEHDSTLCVTAIAWGCMTPGSCNYNSNASADCSNVADGSNTSCCVATDSTSVECVRDFDNDGYQDDGTTSQILPSGNCGCGEIGFGWENIEDNNGAAIWGCMDPTCPEYFTQCNSAEGCANKNDDNCCLGFSVLDSIMMFGEEYADCASDPTLCVETTEFSLLGGYSVDMSACEGAAVGLDTHKEELIWYLGFNGTFSEERYNINRLTGYKADMVNMHQYDSPQKCGNYAGAQNWVCGNLISNTDNFLPCNEEYFEWECNGREDCWWEGPECRWNSSQWAGDKCYEEASMNNQSVCTSNPGCQWDFYGCHFDCWGLDEDVCKDDLLAGECWFKMPESNVDSTAGYCKAPPSFNNDFACHELGISGGTCSNPVYTTEETCRHAGSCSNPIYTTADECWNGGSCSDPSLTTEHQCSQGGTCSDPNFTNESACWNCATCVDKQTGMNVPIYDELACINQGDTHEWQWGNCQWNYSHWNWAQWYDEHNDWYAGESTCWWNWEGYCECEVDNVNNCAGCQAECEAKGVGYAWALYSDNEEEQVGQCEQKPFGAECTQFEKKDNCEAAPATDNCVWDQHYSHCYQEQGADCGMQSMQNQASCETSADCKWWTPPHYNIENVPEYIQGSVADNPGVCNFYSLCEEWYCWDEPEGKMCNEFDCNQDPNCRYEDIHGQDPRCVEDEINQYCDCFVELGQSTCGATGTNTTWDNVKHECMQNVNEWDCLYGDDILGGPEAIDCSYYYAGEEDFEWNGEAGGFCEHIVEDVIEGTWSINGNSLCIEKNTVFVEEACGTLGFEECECNNHRCHWAYTPTYDDPNAGMCNNDGPAGSRVQDVEHYKIKTVSSVFQDEMINYMFSSSSPQCMSFTLQTNGDVHVTQSKPDGSTCNIVLQPESY